MSETYDKIVKIVADAGILDVSPSLHRFVPKGKDLVYQGKLVFSFWQEESGVYLKGYMDKDLCKILCHNVMHHTFDIAFGKKGLVAAGGTIDEKDTRARTLTVTRSSEEDYIIRLQEGPGVVNPNNGTIDHTERIDRDIIFSIPLLEMLRLAHEVYDYIRDAEVHSFMQNRSLHTKSTGSSVESETLAYTPDPVGGNWQIPFGKLKGRYIRELTDDQLTLLLQQKAHDAVMNDMQTHARMEWNKRKKGK